MEMSMLQFIRLSTEEQIVTGLAKVCAGQGNLDVG
jgi:hypothetical protein